MNDKYNQLLALIGQKIEDEDPSNPFQCMDAIFKWCDILGIPHAAVRHLYAYEVITSPTDLTRQYFDIIYNSTTNAPSKGDIVVFGKTVGFAGHVAIATDKSTTKDLVTLDQNWNGLQYLRQVTHYNYYGVIGWLHPKTMTVTDKQKLDMIQQIVFGGDNDSVARSKIKSIFS